MAKVEVKLFLAKIYDERTTNFDDMYNFQLLYTGNVREPVTETFERINDLYIKGYKRYLDPEGSAAPDPLNERDFSPEQIAFVVELLQDLSLTLSDAKNGDLLGGFFEGITRDGFKQSKGLFFTHLNLTTFVLKVLDVDNWAVNKIRSNTLYSERLPFIIDPSCGSGNFLLTAMKLVTDKVSEVREEIAKNDDVRDFLREKFPEDHPNLWAREYLFGIEDSELLAMSTKVNMVLHRDGNMHVYHADGLAPLTRYGDQLLKGREHEEQAYYSKLVANSFDVVASNPPFSITLDPHTTSFLDEAFELANNKNSENMFLERWYQLLKPRGRLGVVLPESFFSTKENLRARLFLFDHFNVKAVVGLPRDAFQPWTPTRTSLLFAQKKTKDEEVTWKDIRRSKQDDAVRTIKRAQKELRALRKIKNVATLDQRGQRGAQIVEAVQNAVSMFDLDGALKTSNVADIHSAVDSFLDAIESVNITQWAFRQSAIANNSKFYVLNVSNIGYKRTKRAEYKRPNDLFTAYEVSSDDHTLTDDRILNLNSSVNDWRVIPEGSGAKDALSLLTAKLQWAQ